MIKVGMVSLGCPKNQMDAELMLHRLREAGMGLVADAALAQVVIINTCGFIEDAKKEAIDNILEFAQLKKEGQIQKLVVTGCLAERYREQLCEQLPECDAVLGLGANTDIVKAVQSVMAGTPYVRFPDKGCWSLEGGRVQTTPSFFAYMRIADGCDNRCAYCAIPLIRGDLKSRPLEALVEEARTLAANGVKELVLVAQDTTVYGRDLYGESRLPQLLDALCEIEGIEWIRLLYCYPEHITEEFLQTVKWQPKVLPYLDIPLQHADGTVLHAMHRRGDADSLKKLMMHIREVLPDVTLRTTVMVGFPGETEEAFDTLCTFIDEVQFERLGCFAFSPEEGTPAFDLPDQLEETEKNRRRDMVMEQQTQIAARHNQQQVGKTLTVLVEGYDKYAGCWFGRSAADAPDIDGKVFFHCPQQAVSAGDFVSVKITDWMDWDLIGDML